VRWRGQPSRPCRKCQGGDDERLGAPTGSRAQPLGHLTITLGIRRSPETSRRAGGLVIKAPLATSRRAR
jgi:hypothetical protein